MTEAQDFGIYILTYPGDYHLATALIESLKYFNQGIPIVIIPGEGFDRDSHPFNIPIMENPGGFWDKLGGANRKFWCFQGPFEKFLYLDADIICLRSLKTFIERVKSQSGKFIFFNMPIKPDEWKRVILDESHERYEQYLSRVDQLGNPERLKQFDPDFDPYQQYAFNNGVFASSIHTLKEDDFRQLYERETDFFANSLGKSFSWRDNSLFFTDQGRMNYLVSKSGISVLDLEPGGNYIWGGCPLKFEIDEVLENRAEFGFIHWAGFLKPTPSYFCQKPLLRFLVLGRRGLEPAYGELAEISGYSVWRYFAKKEQYSFWEKLSWTLTDIKRILSVFLRNYGLLT